MPVPQRLSAHPEQPGCRTASITFGAKWPLNCSLNAPSDPPAMPTPREKEVLALMAEGDDKQAAIGEKPFTVASSVSKHVGNIFTEFGLICPRPTAKGHPRVLGYRERHYHRYRLPES